MKTQNEIRSGVVLWFSKGRGHLRVPGEQKVVEFSMESQRVVLAGFSQPKFDAEAPKVTAMPKKGAQVTLLLEVDSQFDNIHFRRTLRRVVKVVAWNYTLVYQAAEREIAARPVYQVMEFRLCNEEPVSVNQREVIAVGTAAQLQAKFPRGAKNDPLASETRVLALTLRRRFYVLNADGRLQVPDPRPLPKGVVAEPFQRTTL